MLTSVVSSSRSVRGSVSVGVSDATLHGLGAHRARRLRRQRDLALDLRQAFAGGRETIGELRRRETVLERIDRSLRRACLRVCAFRVRRQHAGVRRLAALNQDKGQRHAQRSHRDPVPSRKENGQVRRGVAGERQPGWRDQLSGISDLLRPSTPIAPRSTVNRRKLARV